MSEPANDLITAMMPLLKITPIIEDVCRFGDAWAAPHAPAGRRCAQFHVVTRGSCVLERPALDSLTLSAGDILLLPHGDSHVIRSGTRGVLKPITSAYRNGVRDKTTLGVESDTEILCGRLFFGEGEDNPLLAALPDEIVVRTAGQPLMERFRRILDDIREELDGGKAGAGVIAGDLSRALFAMILRDHLEAAPAQGGTLSLLRDRTTARVVSAVLADPGCDWTLDELAAVAVTSRASLVRSFRKHGGLAPMSFLSELRLAIARQRLAGSNDPIAQIAGDVGYSSEGALSRAIVRRYGLRPGALRLADAPQGKEEGRQVGA